jgi:iron-sulfur cluster repair protein YtfE (RIC family)
MKITKDITIEDLIEKKPAAIDYLKEKGIRCIRCGEPIWGTLEEAAEEKGFSADDIDGFVKDLNSLSNESNQGFEQKIKPDKLD